MPDAMRGTSHSTCLAFSEQPCEVRSDISPILQMKKLRGNNWPMALVSNRVKSKPGQQD